MRELSQQDAVEAYRAGRLTIREFARTLGLDVWGAHDLLATLKVPVAQGSRGESRAGFEQLLGSLGRKKTLPSSDRTPRNSQQLGEALLRNGSFGIRGKPPES